MKIMNLKPHINIEIDGNIYSYKLFQGLDSLSRNHSQRKTAKELNVSHSVLNRRIKNAEKKLGFKLVIVEGTKSYLSEKAVEILNNYYIYRKTLEPTNKIVIVGGHIITGLIDSISPDLPFELEIYSSDDLSSYELSKKMFIDILALDDPLIAYKNNLDFIPMAYDYLVLISNDNKSNNLEIEKISDFKSINNLEFVAVEGTGQRLAWQTLKENNISFEIVKKVKSQFDAFKIVKNSDNLYTFLNGSYFKGNNVLKNQTQHVISLVHVNKNNINTKRFIEYILNESQKLIANQGFTPIKPWKVQNKK